ncbi:MAG: PAS domain-containing protein, partial [Pseudomonadota bacterium]
MADKDLSNPIRAVTAASVPEPIVAAPDGALAPSGPLELAQPSGADGLSTHYLERELSEVLRRPEMINFLDGGVLDGVWYWDLEAPEHEYMSPGFWRALGFDPAKRKHLAAEWQDLIFPEDRDLALDNFHRHVDNPDHPYDQIVRYRSATGGTVTVRCRGFAVRK